MMSFKYSGWDGTQNVDPFTAKELMDHIADKLLDGSDLRSALRELLQHGGRMPSGRQMPGMRDLLDRLRQRRQEQLSRYNMDSVMDDIREKLNQVIETEREGIQRRLAETDVDRDGAGADPQLREMLERMAGRHMEQLDKLPPQAGARIQQLREYDFMDQDARQQFEELLETLQQQVLQQYFQGLKQGLGAMTPEIMGQMKQMMRDLNQLLEQHRRGDDSGFQDFMDKWGQFFPEGMQNPEQLAQHLQQQMAEMQSLLNSMTPQMRQELLQMMGPLLQDNDLQNELSDLIRNLGRMFPNERGQGMPFFGDDPVTLQEAMRVMGDMKDLEELEQDLLDSVRNNNAADLGPDQIGQLLGDEARRIAEELQELTRMLKEGGIIRDDGKDPELTPRALRKIGERALEQIFGRIDQGLTGEHTLRRNGWGAERLDETKPYVFGDALNIDLPATLKNAVRREGDGTPVRLEASDFEVYRTASVNQCSTVILLDMSGSMHRRGYFTAARRVALALDSLIRNKFPRDVLYLAAFSSIVRQLTSPMLLENWWIETHGTDFVEALRAGRSMLKRHKDGSKQIILITDGRPRGAGYGYSYWDYDRDWSIRDDMEATLREVNLCTKDGITVNTFMLDNSSSTTTFIRAMTKLNKGRAFFADPNQLGEYLIVDYLKNRRSRT